MAISKSTELAAAGNYPSERHNARERKLLETAESYSPSNDDDWSEQPDTQDEALDQLAAQTIKSVIATYDFAVDGGAEGDIALGVTIPDNAIVTLVGYDVIEAPESAGDTGTIKITLGAQASGDLVAAITADGAASEAPAAGAITGWANAKKATAARELTATIATEDLTAGKILVFVDYRLSV